MRRRLAAGLVVSAAGCSVIYGNDLDEARAPGDGADAAGTSSSSSSSSGAASSGGDAGPLSEGAAPTGCAAYLPSPKLCVDFDGPAASLDAFTVDDRSGTIAIQADTFASPPRSARVRLTSATDCSYARLEKSFRDAGQARFEVHFALRPVKPWKTSTPFALNIEDGQGKECQPIFTILASADKVTDDLRMNVQTGGGDTNDDRDLAGLPATDAWTPIDIVFTPAPPGLRFQIRVGGVMNEYTFDQCPAAWKAVTTHFGFHCDRGEVVADYDDIRVDWDGP